MPSPSPSVAACLFLLSIPALFTGCASSPTQEEAPHPDFAHLLILRSGDLEIGVLPPAGGRIVLLRIAGGPNLLKSNPAGWQPAAWPEIRPDVARRNFEGHTYWLAPQSNWWNQQDVLPPWRGRLWPPDPFLSMAPYEIVESGSSEAVLRGPASPVSGVSLTKTVRVGPGRQVHLSAVAENVREEPVHWALWSNTRFYGDVPFRIALEGTSGSEIRYSHPENFFGEISPDGKWFTFPSFKEMPQDARPVVNKAFISTRRAYAEVFFEEWTLVKAMQDAQPDHVHPEHGAVEVFLQRHPNRDSSLLEIEFHGPYGEIAPGHSIRIEETWTLRPARRNR